MTSLTRTLNRMDKLQITNFSVDFKITSFGRAVPHAGNKGFAIAGVPCFVDTLVLGGSSVLRMKFSANKPRHRKPPERYAQHVNDVRFLNSWN